MAQQGVFNLPPNIRFGVTGFANSSGVQAIQVFVDNEVRATFNGQSTDNKVIGTQVLNSGHGAVQIKVSVNGRQSDLVSVQTTLSSIQESRRCRSARLPSLLQKTASADLR